MELIGILVLAIILYLTSSKLIATIFKSIYVLSHNRSVAVSLTTLFLFPGTVIHELSHLFTAEILGVRTGKLSLAPDDIRGSSIGAGYVMVSETDPVRRMIIGIAPLLVGIPALTILTLLSTPLVSHVFESLWMQLPLAPRDIFFTLGALWALMAIGASMFPSREDMKEAWPVLILLLLLIIPLFFFGQVPAIPEIIRMKLGVVVQQLLFGLAVTATTHISMILMLYPLQRKFVGT